MLKTSYTIRCYSFDIVQYSQTISYIRIVHAVSGRILLLVLICLLLI
jgi:hypothetical protein